MSQKNYPSIKTLMQIKGVNLESAKDTRNIMLATKREELESSPIYEIYWDKIGHMMYNPHSFSELKLQLLDIAIGGYGIEGFKTPKNGYCTYVNMGESYTGTILFFEGRFIVSTMGDIAEKYNAE